MSVPVSAPARSDPLPKVLIALTVVTGIVDVVAFLGIGQVFTAFMTATSSSSVSRPRVETG